MDRDSFVENNRRWAECRRKVDESDGTIKGEKFDRVERAIKNSNREGGEQMVHIEYCICQSDQCNEPTKKSGASSQVQQVWGFWGMIMAMMATRTSFIGYFLFR